MFHINALPNSPSICVLGENDLKELSSTGKELQATVTSGLNMWRAPEGNGVTTSTGEVWLGACRRYDDRTSRRLAAWDWIQMNFAAFAQSMQTSVSAELSENPR